MRADLKNGGFIATLLNKSGSSKLLISLAKVVQNWCTLYRPHLSILTDKELKIGERHGKILILKQLGAACFQLS